MSGRATADIGQTEDPMLDQVMESFRKASESSLQMQQDIFKRWTQQWFSSPSNGASAEWSGSAQRRSIDLAIEALNKHRESLEASYRSSIQVLEQAFRVTEARSPEDCRRMVEDLWRNVLNTMKEQSENQFREMMRWTEKLFEVTPRPAEQSS
jgi:hypothetical protein